MNAPLRSIHVVAGVITDAQGRILLTQRALKQDMGGLWEFPGGKRELGETSAQALVRELREELGIEAEVGESLIEVPQRYPDKHLRLEVCKVTGYSGEPRGCEGQPLKWVSVDELSQQAMPPADYPVVGRLLQSDSYLVTPEPGEDDAWLNSLEQVLEQGIYRVQLRAPNLANRAKQRWEGLATKAVALCRQMQVEVLVNRDIALAQRLGIGVHLGSEQLSQLTQRPLPAGVAVAASCHNLEELQAAERLDCDFAVLGAIKETASHPGVAGIGWQGFEGLRQHVALPIYAIGGLGLDDMAQAHQHGAQGIAAIRSLWP